MEHLNKIEHLGIAVRSLEEGNALYTKLLGVPPYKETQNYVRVIWGS